MCFLMKSLVLVRILNLLLCTYHVYSCILINWNQLFLRDTYQDLVWPRQCVGWYDTVILPFPVSNVYHICIVQDSLFQDMDIGTMLQCAFVVSCTPSQPIWLDTRWPGVGVSFSVLLTISLIVSHIITIAETITRILWPFFHLNYTFRLSVTKKFWFCKCPPTWMFPPLDIPFEYFIEHVILRTP